MAAAALARLGRRRTGLWLGPGPGPGPGRGHWTAARRSRSRREAAEAEAAAPVLQYVGERATRVDRVFVWGFSFSGALGVPSFVLPRAAPAAHARLPRRRVQPLPYRLELPERICSAACGYGFTLLSSKTKDITKVWGMGLNKDSQLGFHRSRKDKARGYEYVLEPSPIPLPLDRPQETRVLQVSCGRAHSLVLTDREGVFSMGNNSYGQCGRKVIENETYSESHRIHRMQDFDGQVVQVACGQDHSLFLTDQGEVYACGWGADGQTGLGHYNITSVPTKLGGDLAGVKVVQVATYGDCCLAVSADGALFGWGNSEYLQLASVTESTQVNIPRRLPFSGVGTVKQAACGGTGCALLNGEGHVFVWGYGILGKGPNLVETALPEKIPPTLFGLTEFNPEVQVSLIRCGLSHFAALTTEALVNMEVVTRPLELESVLTACPPGDWFCASSNQATVYSVADKGELFVWGKNIRGCLGIGRLEDQYFPWRVTMPGEPVDVACGVDHTVTLAKSFI